MSVDDKGKVIVARILSNSYIESQRLLRPGDIILEANGIRVQNPEQVDTSILSVRLWFIYVYSRYRTLQQVYIYT